MISGLATPWLVVIFALAGLVVVLAGTRLTDIADRLADRTGLGEAVMGALLLGLTTSLAGTVVSVSAAFDGRASLAFSNAVGGIAAQTAFLVVGDILYRRANLEHSSADAGNLLQAAVLALMLALPVLAWTGPEMAIWGIHPVSALLPVIYVLAVQQLSRLREHAMWHPVRTRDTRADEPEETGSDPRATAALAWRFALLAAALGLAGYAISVTGGALSDRLGIAASLVGALMTAVVTSLPELVTTLAAIRRGALQLAVAGIIGGNCFDVLFLTLSDAAYRPGSIYHAVGPADYFWVATGLVMTAILLIGLIVRERRGIANIGFESAAILVVYAVAVGLAVSGG